MVIFLLNPWTTSSSFSTFRLVDTSTRYIVIPSAKLGWDIGLRLVKSDGLIWKLASDWSRVITWHSYWPLIDLFSAERTGTTALPARLWLPPGRGTAQLVDRYLSTLYYLSNKASLPLVHSKIYDFQCILKREHHCMFAGYCVGHLNHR